MRPGPSAGQGAIRHTLLFLATLLGTASAARPNRVVPVHADGSLSPLPDPVGFLDDLIPVLKGAGVELFYVARPTLTTSQYGAEALTATLQGCASAGTCSLTVLAPIPAREGLASDKLRWDRTPAFMSWLMPALFGPGVYQLGTAPAARLTALMTKPDLPVHAASTHPRSPFSPRPFVDGEAPGVMSAPLEMMFEVVVGRNRIYSPFSQSEYAPPSQDYEVPAEPQLEQAQRDRYRLFRESRLLAAAIVTSDSIESEHMGKFADHFRLRGFAVTRVPLYGDVTAIVIAPGSVVGELRQFAQDFGPAVVVEEPMSPRANDAGDGHGQSQSVNVRKVIAVVFAAATAERAYKAWRDAYKRAQDPARAQGNAQVPDVPVVPDAPVVQMGARRGGAARQVAGARRHNARPEAPEAGPPRIIVATPARRGPVFDFDRSPKQAALDVSTALGNATGDALTAVLKSITLEMQAAAMDPRGVAVCAGMLHGVIDHARGNARTLIRYFDALGIDYPTVRQLVADARLQQDTWQLEAAQKLLLTDVQAVRLAVNARHAVPHDDFAVQRWASARQQAQPAVSTVHERSTAEAQAGRPGVIRINRSAVTDKARRIARGPAGDGRTAGIVIGADIFIPGPHVLPHLHINDKMATLTLGHGSDGGHKDLVSGDALQSANLDEGIRLLEADPVAGGAAMLEMLRYLRED